MLARTHVRSFALQRVEHADGRSSDGVKDDLKPQSRREVARGDEQLNGFGRQTST